VTLNTPILGVVCIYRLGFDTVHLYAKFDDSKPFQRYGWCPPKFKDGLPSVGQHLLPSTDTQNLKSLTLSSIGFLVKIVIGYKYKKHSFHALQYGIYTNFTIFIKGALKIACLFNNNVSASGGLCLQTLTGALPFVPAGGRIPSLYP